MKTDNADTHHISIGCPTDWAFIPLKQELKKAAGKYSLKYGEPEAIKKQMKEGQLDLAPCPTTCLFRNPNFEMAMPLGLSSKGASHDMFIALNETTFNLPDLIRNKLNILKEIFQEADIASTSNLKLTGEWIWKQVRIRLPKNQGEPPKLRFRHASGPQAALARLLYHLLWGETACKTNDFMNSGSSHTFNGFSGNHVDLISGHDGLLKKCHYHKVYDLGQLWYDLTGLPFVSMVWQKLKTNTIPVPKARINQICELAQARMKVEPTSYLPEIIPLDGHKDAIDLGAYWKNLNYKLGADEIRGLLFFLQMIQPLEKQIQDDSFTVKMIRWQERGIEGSAKA